MDQKFYTTEEIAAILRVNEITVIRRIKSGKLGAIKTGKIYLITQEQLDKYLSTNLVRG